jgi:hypothetical protein
VGFDAEAFQYLRSGEPLGVRMFRRGGIEVGVEELFLRRTGAERLVVFDDLFDLFVVEPEL